jgi:hypothetical protein
MNIKTDILRQLVAVLNAGGYNRTVIYDDQKPKNDTYLKIIPASISELRQTTGGAVYDIALDLLFFTNGNHDLNAEMDKIRNILTADGYYRDTDKTYYYNLVVNSFTLSEADEQYKFMIQVTIKHEEVV